MATRKQEIGAAVVRILKKEGGSMFVVPLEMRMLDHMMLRPTYAEVQDAISSLVLDGQCVYRGNPAALVPGNDTCVLWLKEFLPA
ncbi:MAG: hypothetical protein WA211_10095 [Candidatus Acidiferrales bacterium]